jgi:hypothetical protein
VCESRF